MDLEVRIKDIRLDKSGADLTLEFEGEYSDGEHTLSMNSDTISVRLSKSYIVGPGAITIRGIVNPDPRQGGKI